jgi:hypothetical protein
MAKLILIIFCDGCERNYLAANSAVVLDNAAHYCVRRTKRQTYTTLKENAVS